MKRQSFAWEGGGTEFRQGLWVEKGTMNRLLSKLAREGDWIQIRIKSREIRYNESSLFSNILMKRQSFAWEGGGTEFRQGLWVEKGTTNRLLSKLRFTREGDWIQIRIKSREIRYNESSLFSNILMKRQSFAWEGGGTEFRQGLWVEKGTTNRLLSNFRASRGKGGGKLPPPCTHPPRERASRAL